MGVVAEFRAYAAESHAVDLSIGVVVGSALGTLATSLVFDIVAPLIGLAVGGVDFLSLAIPMKPPTPPSVNLGRFVGSAIGFLAVCLVMCLVLKFVNTARKERQKERTVAPQAPTTSEKILLEIRDTLKQIVSQAATRIGERTTVNDRSVAGERPAA